MDNVEATLEDDMGEGAGASFGARARRSVDPDIGSASLIEVDPALDAMVELVASGDLADDEAKGVMAGVRDTCGLSSDGRAASIAADVLAGLLPDGETVELPVVGRVGGGIAYRAAKRAFDVCACSLALVVMAVPMLVIAARIRRESPGPAMYAQEREGLGGRPFRLYKFRSMYSDAEERGARWAADEDPRITPYGAHLRRTRLASVIIGTPGDGESTKSLSRSANSSLDLQLCECRPGLCSTCNSHYKPFEFLSLGIFGGVPSLSRNLVGCNGFSPSEESAIRFSFLGFGKDGACAAW